MDIKENTEVLTPTERQRLFRAQMETEGWYHLSTWVKEVSVGDVINEVFAEKLKKNG